MHDLRPFIDTIEQIVASHCIEAGSYRRWNLNPDKDRGRDAYGCADAANILYSIGRFPRDPGLRANHVRHLREMQNQQDGLWHDATHHQFHTTAHCTAALELFDASPFVPLHALHPHRSPEGVRALLESLDWAGNPWPQSHLGAGLYAALTIANEADADFVDAYFDWLWAEADPETGLWRRKCIDSAVSTKPISHHLGGSFHYVFNHVAARRALRYPEALIDTCLRIRSEDLWPGLGTKVGFAEIDWVFCITRPLRQCGHRHGECMQALREFSDGYLSYLDSLDLSRDPTVDDLHQLFGTVCCLAELQLALPGSIRSEQPLKQVLDRRPFI